MNKKSGVKGATKKRFATLEENIRHIIITRLKHFNYNRTHTAKSLKISLTGLRKRIRVYKSQGFNIPDHPKNKYLEKIQEPVLELNSGFFSGLVERTMHGYWSAYIYDKSIDQVPKASQLVHLGTYKNKESAIQKVKDCFKKFSS